MNERLKPRRCGKAAITAATAAMLLALGATPRAQSADPAPPPRAVPEITAPVQCDRFAGAAKEQCLRVERQNRQSRGLSGSCDELAGPAREACLQRGGTVEAGAKSNSSAGAGAPPAATR